MSLNNQKFAQNFTHSYKLSKNGWMGTFDGFYPDASVPIHPSISKLLRKKNIISCAKYQRFTYTPNITGPALSIASPNWSPDRVWGVHRLCMMSHPPQLAPGTLPKTNIAPTNGWLEYYFPIGEAYFQGLR